MPGSSTRKHSVTIRGHRTSFSLEDLFWTCLRRMAGERGMTISQLVAEFDAERDEAANLSSMIRLKVLDWVLASPEARASTNGRPVTEAK